TIIISSIFGIFYNVSIGSLFGISLFVTGATYLIGDLLLLPRVGNVIASVADFGLVFALIWVLSSLFIEVTMPIVIASLAAAFFVACCEPLFHAYMIECVLTTNKDPLSLSQLQTEFAEETDAQTMTYRNEEKERDKQL